MTYIAPAGYRLPTDLDPRSLITTPEVIPSEITVVVPTKDDQAGVLQTLQSLLQLRVPPKHIRFVDDGSRPPIEIPDLPGLPTTLSLIRLPFNRGPATARNYGVEGLEGWIYFTDCGCEHAPGLFEHLAQARSEAPEHCVAIASPVVANGDGSISRYMTEEGSLNPPILDGLPQTVITANVLVHATAGAQVGWFDTRFREAGGEDLDFGLRLRQVGEVGWCPRAAVAHTFEDSIDDFDNRFLRYGRGIRTLARKWGTDIEPHAFQARSADLQWLADRQHQRLREGYKAA